MKAGGHILNRSHSKDPEIRSSSQDLSVKSPVWLNYVDVKQGSYICMKKFGINLGSGCMNIHFIMLCGVHVYIFFLWYLLTIS